MASSSFSTSTNERKYDVFISFRGADTRLGFSGYLSYALREKGIKTFFDDGELQKGEVINSALENAIKESRVALVIFSENYASSKFCLEELSEIMECRKEKGTLVWPIFYKIDPADVRHQRGSYAEAFERHEARYATPIIRKWRLALQEAALISGSHYSGQTYEHKFINDIIHEIIQPISEKAKVLNGPHEDLENHLQTIAKLRSDIQFFGSLKDLKNRDAVINIANNLLAKAISKVEDEFKRLYSSYRDARSNVLEECLQKHGVEKLNKDAVQRLQRENLEVKIGNIASCQVDPVKDGGHIYFIKFLDNMEAYPEHRAMAAFVLAVIVDGHRRGQEACTEAGLVHVCLKHLQGSSPNDSQTKTLFLKWLCLCLGKLWEDFPEAQTIGLQEDAPSIYAPLLSEPQQEVRAAAVFALGTLLNVGFGSCRGVGGDEECDDDDKFWAEASVVKSLLSVALDGSPLVRAEVAVALARFVLGHNKHLKSIAAPGFRSSPAVVPLRVLELNPTLNPPCPSSLLFPSPLMNGQNGIQQLLERCSCWRGSQSANPHWKPQTNSLLNLSPSLANIIGSGGGCPSQTQHTPHGSILSSQIGPVLRVGNVRDGRVSSSSPLTNSGIMHGSPLSDMSSHHSDSGILNDGFSNGVLNHTGPRPLDNALYSQCVLAMHDLAKDPSPSIANLGRRVLSIIGIEQVVAKPSKSTGVRSSESAAFPSLAGLASSSSGFDMNGGHLPQTFRTPPVSPPRPSYIIGMRRVCSLEFRPHVMSSPDSGLADPLLGSGGTSGNSDNSFLPQSTIYNWSCGHFSKPLLTAADDSEEVLGRREEREKFALEHIAKCQHSAVSRLSNPIAKWDIKGTQTALLQPFSPIVIAADENECFRIWNHEKATLLNSFDNHDFPDKGISKLCLVNELDDSFLLAASSDGNIRIWKDYSLKGKQKLVTAFSSIHGHKPGVRCRNAVVDWQQQSGYLYASCEISSIMLWDLDKEQLLNHIPSSSYCSISALAASQVHGGQFAAGFLDGSVRLYDVRTPQMLVCGLRPHIQRVEKVVGIGFQPGLDPGKIVSASLAGDIQFIDIRNYSSAYLSIDAHRGSLTALAVHIHAPIIASGSAKQLIKVFSLEGDQLDFIGSYPTLMAPKIGTVMRKLPRFPPIPSIACCRCRRYVCLYVCR